MAARTGASSLPVSARPDELVVVCAPAGAFPEADETFVSRATGTSMVMMLSPLAMVSLTVPSRFSALSPGVVSLGDGVPPGPLDEPGELEDPGVDDPEGDGDPSVVAVPDGDSEDEPLGEADEPEGLALVEELDGVGEAEVLAPVALPDGLGEAEEPEGLALDDSGDGDSSSGITQPALKIDSPSGQLRPA